MFCQYCRLFKLHYCAKTEADLQKISPPVGSLRAVLVDLYVFYRGDKNMKRIIMWLIIILLCLILKGSTTG